MCRFPSPSKKSCMNPWLGSKKQNKRQTNRTTVICLISILYGYPQVIVCVCVCVCVQTTFHYIFWSMLIHFKAFIIISQRSWMYHLIFNLYDTPSSTHHHEFGMSTSTQQMLVIQHVPSTPNQTIVVDQCLQIAAAFVCARRQEALLNHSG